MRLVGGLALLVALAVGVRAQSPEQPRGTWIPGTLEIHHVYVGQGDSVLVVSPSGRTLLFDLGERDWPLHENAELVAQYVERITGKRELDYIVISHYHQDHVGNLKLTESGNEYDGGVFWLLKEHALVVHKIVDRGFEPLLPRVPIALKYKKFAESAEGKRLLTRETARLGAGQIDLGSEVTVTVVAANGRALGPDGKEVTLLTRAQIEADPPPSENDLSVCLTFRWNEFEYFVGGDLSGQDHVSQFGYRYHDIESGVAPGVGNVEVYRANHHGSDHSSNKALVDTLDPEVSIVSSGTANRFGHPRQSIVDRLAETGDLFVTAREGGASSARFKRAVEGGTVVVRAYNHGYNYEVALVRSYRSFSDEEEARHLDRVLDYERQQVEYEEASGVRPPDDDEDGSKPGDVTAGKTHPATSGGPEPPRRPPTAIADPVERNGITCVRARDRDQLVKYVGKRVCVWGRVTSTFTPASNKVKFLNVDTEDLARSFTLVVFAKDWPNFLETPGIGDPCKFYRDKWVLIVGVVEAYEPKKVEEAETQPPAKPPAKPLAKPPAEPAAKPAAKLEMVVSGPHQIEILPYREDAPVQKRP